MTSLNKYHSSGRLYTDVELRTRRHALSVLYIYAGYHRKNLTDTQGRPILEATIIPYRRRHGE